MPVNRCVCHNVPFDTVLNLVNNEGLTLDQVIDQTGATTGCGTCMPYLRLALATGEPSLPVMSQTALDEAIRTCAQCRRPKQAPPNTPNWTYTGVDLNQ